MLKDKSNSRRGKATITGLGRYSNHRRLGTHREVGTEAPLKSDSDRGSEGGLTPLLIINLRELVKLTIVIYYSMEELGIIIALFQPRHARFLSPENVFFQTTKCFLAFSGAARFCSDGHSS
jgi:hypothetical protein